MPRQVYICKHHGEFILYMSFDVKVPEFALCPVIEKHNHDECHEAPCKYECLESSPWVPSKVIHVSVKRDWNEKANIARANPADQMKAQLDSVKKAEEARERYNDPRANFLEGE